MAKSKVQKKDILNDLRDKLERARTVVFAGFDKLTVGENNELRQLLKKEQSEYVVAKKTLLQMALKEKAGLEIDSKELAGKVAAVFGYGDEVAPAKVLAGFMKTHEERLSFSGGILEGKFIGAEAVKQLSQLPGKQELYAKMVGSLNAPISGFANVLAGNLRKFVYALNAIKDSKE